MSLQCGRKASHYALRGLTLVISLALLAWLIRDGRWHGLGQRVLQLEWPTLIIATLLFALSYLLRAARVFDEFRHETQAQAAHPSSFASLHFLRFLRLTLIHNALVNVAPMRAGELAFPILLKRWFDVAAERSVVALLWLRMQDALVVLALAAMVWPGLYWPVRSAALLAIVGIAWGIPAWNKHHANRTPTASPRWSKIRAAFAQSTRSHGRSWLWTLGNWSVKISAEAWLLMQLLHIEPSVAALGALGAELAAILPLQGVAGFGTFEASAAALMRTYNVALTDGLQAALVLHLIMLSCAVLAGGAAAAFLPGDPQASASSTAPPSSTSN